MSERKCACAGAEAEEKEGEGQGEVREQRRTLWRILISVVLLAAVWLLPTRGTLRLLLFLVPYLLAGWDILWEAAEGVFRGKLFDENFLMAVATIGALALGDYPEAVAVMVFYKTGELFEDYAVGKSRRNIAALMDIRPDSAVVEREGGAVRVPPAEVAVGEIIVVRPGEKIPIDGVVVEGEGALDTSALTGESLPRDCAPGQAVVSGSVSLTALLRIRTTKVFGESTVSRILELVQTASEKKSRSENFITRFARVYTPAVCGGALLLAVLPPAIRGLLLGLAPDWGDWVRRALTFLVISCPCALVISIPLGFFGGLGGASRRGVLIKGSGFLEALAETDCVVFDKTGTLTRGVFEVTEVRPAEALRREDVLEKAALCESFSTHPISRSLVAAWGGTCAQERVSGVQELSGRGVTARVDGVSVACGNGKLMEALGLTCPPLSGAGTVVYVAVGGVYAGAVLIADRPKPTARAAVDALRSSGVSRIVMLTGDARAAADAVSAELGLTEARSELLPGDKVAEVEALLAGEGPRGRLAFVGDGINDAPVLARADIGIAMGALGSDAAIEAADVVLMDDDPAKIPLAIRISRKCMGIVRQNIVFALTVKIACLVLGALGLASMWIAIFADVGVMMLAVLNAMRTLDTKKL